MADEEPPGFDGDAEVIAFRHPDTGAPVPVPKELALSENRAFKAYNYHLGGMQWQKIAEALDYADARAAQYDVAQYVETARSLYNSFTATQRRAMALARLEALLSAGWKQAMEGNLTAIAQAHGLVVSTIKLERLDQVGESDEGEGGGTVIIGGDGDEYLAGLEKAAED